MKVYSIGFTKKTAAEFFTTLRQAKIRRLLDVRLHNSSQLAGFSKRGDLAFFLKELCGAAYRHEPLLTPTPDLLEGQTWPQPPGSSLVLVHQGWAVP